MVVKHSYFYKVDLGSDYCRAISQGLGVQMAPNAPGGGVQRTTVKFAMAKKVTGEVAIDGTDGLMGPSTNGEPDTNTANNIIYDLHKSSGEAVQNENDSVFEKITVQDGVDNTCIAELNYDQANGLSEIITDAPFYKFIVTGGSGKFASAKYVIVEYDNHTINDGQKKAWNASTPEMTSLRRVTVMASL